LQGQFLASLFGAAMRRFSLFDIGMNRDCKGSFPLFDG
jgi:hypothetical protein